MGFRQVKQRSKFKSRFRAHLRHNKERSVECNYYKVINKSAKRKLFYFKLFVIKLLAMWQTPRLQSLHRERYEGDYA